MNNLESVLYYQKKYKDYWTSKNNFYWFYRLFQEVTELFLALLRLHRHKPELELIQIASICLNWLNKIDPTN